ncbi:hypothetical protein LTR82_014809 [Friedmanniomyces endolithicus]|uniref:Uncharacterized protein n=1 Tax=Friedmanniomyces endolithicus TaxID=329885 RepID=A0AAN6J734_9PEZI|nr:hypothetical protein LTR82_014809 [Friedmanniomyces endolithicus]
MPSAHGLKLYLTDGSKLYPEHRLPPDPATLRARFDHPAQCAIIRRRGPARTDEVAIIKLRAGADFHMYSANALHIHATLTTKKSTFTKDMVFGRSRINKLRKRGLMLWNLVKAPEVVEGSTSEWKLRDCWPESKEDEVGFLSVAVIRGRTSSVAFQKIWEADREKDDEVAEKREEWLENADFQKLRGENGGWMVFRLQLREEDFELGQSSEPAVKTAEHQKASPVASSSDPAPKTASSSVDARVQASGGEKEQPQQEGLPPGFLPNIAPVLNDKSQASVAPVQKISPIIDKAVLTDCERQPAMMGGTGTNTSPHPSSASTSANVGTGLTKHGMKSASLGPNPNPILIGHEGSTVLSQESAASAQTEQETTKHSGASALTEDKPKDHMCPKLLQLPAGPTSAQSTNAVVDTPPVKSELSRAAASGLTAPTGLDSLIKQREEAADPSAKANTLQHQQPSTRATEASATVPTPPPKAPAHIPIVESTLHRTQTEPAGVVTHGSGDGPVLGASALGKRKVSGIDEDREHEAELRYQLMEIDLEKKRIRVNRKLRELEWKKRVGGEAEVGEMLREKVGGMVGEKEDT